MTMTTQFLMIGAKSLLFTVIGGCIRMLLLSIDVAQHSNIIDKHLLGLNRTFIEPHSKTLFIEGVGGTNKGLNIVMLHLITAYTNRV